MIVVSVRRVYEDFCLVSFWLDRVIELIPASPETGKKYLQKSEVVVTTSTVVPCSWEHLDITSHKPNSSHRAAV